MVLLAASAWFVRAGYLPLGNAFASDDKAGGFGLWATLIVGMVAKPVGLLWGP
jgi:hypothetical protein